MANELTDALSNMKTHLETQSATWGISRFEKWASYTVGEVGPAIAIELDEGIRIELVGVSAPSLPTEWNIPMVITYWSEHFSLQNATDDVISQLEKIINFLLANHNPNGAGELLIAGESLGAQVKALPTNDPAVQLIGGQIGVTLTVQSTVTMV